MTSSQAESEFEFEHPDKKLIHPDFLFKHAWEYQNLLADLQGDINKAIEEVQVAVSSVLKSSTNQTLKQYEDHTEAVEDAYVPFMEQFKAVKPGQCRTDGEVNLFNTATQSGYRAGLCSYTYHSKVDIEVANANKALVRFDDLYSQVQSIVIKSFIGYNQFLTPEDIQDKITEIYELVEGRWAGSKPEIESVRRNLAAAIAAQNTELGNCHNANINYINRIFTLHAEMVQVCIDLENIPKSSKSKMSRDSLLQKKAEIQEFINNEPEYQWKA